MNVQSAKNLLEQQVALIRPVIELRAEMSQHLAHQVLPYLDPAGQEVVKEVIEYLDEETDIDDDLPYFLDVALGEIRKVLPPEAHGKEATGPDRGALDNNHSFGACRQLTPEEEVLQAAMQPIGVLYRATRRALDHADAIRQSFRLLGME
ncbi:hypothetical protein [Tateyamaria sp. syn59]|uniref:hypothetical protein n=1 Tax=Tateyamaria sp. syn59 TaxID=2576942 RepID=UPI0011BFB971|nr:hypothetical protein [Tateyamaria sp. syn59]